MKTLVLCYSFEGNCRTLAEAMAEAVGGEHEELLPVEDIMSSHPLGKYLTGGQAALLTKTIPLHPLSRHPGNYDLVVVGGPVWFFTVTPAVRSFLDGQRWNGGRVGLFAMHRGGKGAALRVMRSLVTERGGRVAGTADFTDLRRGDATATIRRAVDWIAGLTSREEDTHA